jgi:hypothetical protein
VRNKFLITTSALLVLAGAVVIHIGTSFKQPTTSTAAVLTPARPVNWPAGKPKPNMAVRVVDPSLAVVIDLAALYSRQPHFRRPNVVLLPALRVNVVGWLDAWVVSETGWFGFCRYRVKLGHAQYSDQSHLVPGWALRRANQWEVQRGTMRGELM